jgi:monofunctional glycosyltransferase
MMKSIQIFCVLALLLPISPAVRAEEVFGLWTVPNVSALAKKNPRATALMLSRLGEAREGGRSLKAQWSWVPLANISPHLHRAVIIAEDASFYQHDGFDWEGIREAAARNIETGRLARGGSTITQQLAKNLYLSTEKNLLRKMKEAWITWSLERHLTKKRILEIYLNVVEWGDGIYGAEAAARHHFGKHAANLTLSEATLLTAILPAPLKNDPLVVTPYLAKRQKQILYWMQRTSVAD